jgi:M6 family metalloprotease-like protein
MRNLCFFSFLLLTFAGENHIFKHKNKDMRKLLMFIALFATIAVQAQRIGCVVRSGDRSATRTEYYTLPEPMDFDPQVTYRQPVVLISFKDQDFSMDDPKDYYNRLLNENGFNSGSGPGCAAEYFREQSGGRLNLQFDIYGPFKVDAKAGGHGYRYYGNDIMRGALKQLCETETTDFSIYDWDRDGNVNQVLFVAAGYCGQQIDGYIYPNTGSFFGRLPGDIYLSFASITSELWKDGSLYGFGTLVHEFCHCLGLPDVYPMNGDMFSMVDEWDLMDGGNYINKGWCPPNLTAMEKMYLKWEQPEELTEPTTITDMKPVSAGGKTYLIRNSGNPDEYYLLENRRQKGWDYSCPGNGLLIYHVDYLKSAWRNNEVNISNEHYRYDLFHADKKDYYDWDPDSKGKDPNKYTMPDNMRNSYLSTSSYPYTNPVTLAVNDGLTDTSSPAATLITPAADGRLFMGKSITNIRLADDGTISFDFMKDVASAITATQALAAPDAWYTLDGRRLTGEPATKGLYIRRSATGQSRVTLVP